MAINEAEKLVIELTAGLMQSTADSWESLYKQVSEELERVREERDLLARKAARWDAFCRLVHESNIENGTELPDKHW